MLDSYAYGPFDPLNPAKPPGIFAYNLVAEAIEIAAPIELVWDIMTGFEHYPEWNPFNRFFKLDTEAKAGETVTFGPVWGPYGAPGDPLPEHGFVQRETITVWEENQCLAYAQLSALFAAERAQSLSVLENGNTRYQTYERMRGLGVPILRALVGKKIMAGFDANGIALKVRAEALAGS